VSFFFDCRDEATFKALFDRLSDEGNVHMPPDRCPFARWFVWLSDRYGVSWQLSVALE
jgi:predicted 3-demethylubiquinone-9 3-methyltransferase (glyoxalase superfamily)